MLTKHPSKLLYSVKQIQELDRLAIEEYRVAGYALMQRAAQAAYRVLKIQWPNVHNVVIVCGTGNNGGDGYLFASLAQADGLTVSVIQMGDPAGASDDAVSARRQWIDSGGAIASVDESKSLLSSADVIVDALLGSGLQRDVSGQWRALIADINCLAVPVLAMDIPSGLNADTGAVMGIAIQAASTVTFIGQKKGMYSAQGPDYTGEIFFDDLDVPAGIYDRVNADCLVLDQEMLLSTLPVRPPTCHKGQLGHVLVVGGDKGMAGAVRLAAEAAARCGAGLVSIATRKQHAALISMQRPELMCHGVENEHELQALLDKASVVVVGPGLGQTQWARDLLKMVLATQLALVVDADALNLISVEPLKRGRWILTPHVGEAARLLASTTAEVQHDRFSAVHNLSERYNCVAVLKGAGTLIQTVNDKKVYLCRHGNAGMASGGMGDVLSGVIAGLLAQGLSFSDAAHLGVLAHALAADEAATQGQRGMLASDLFVSIRRYVNAELIRADRP